MNILGINGSRTIKQHEPGAALVQDGKIVAVCEEERYARVKSARGWLPIQSITACLRIAKLSIRDIDYIYYPGETYPEMPERIRQYLIHYFGFAPEIRSINHQLAHLASAFFCSSFQEAMCISYDGYGDSLSAALAKASREKGIEIIETRDWDDSLGMFYATITSFLGFQVTEDEYKVMGLAAYGNNNIDLSDMLKPTDGGYTFNKEYMRPDIWHLSIFEPYYSQKLISLLGQPRQPSSSITDRHKDIACSAQKTLEECLISLVTKLHDMTNLPSLCLAGGVALNCSANMSLLKLPFIKNLFVQPAASDRGLPLGCALQGAFENGDHAVPLENAFLGEDYGDQAIVNALKLTGQKYVELHNPTQTAADMLFDGKIIGWYRGRSEYGPRALGNRSILADPRKLSMKDEINSKIKFREEFRPFAPSTLEENSQELFEMKSSSSPYMTIAYPVKEDWASKLQAVTHVNCTARVQTVNVATSPEYHELISNFYRLTGVPTILNTSFNIRGQPIVETPLDALSTFSSTGLDAVFLGNFLVVKNQRTR